MSQSGRSSSTANNSLLNRGMLLFSRPSFLCFAGVCGLIALKRQNDESGTITKALPVPTENMKTVIDKQSTSSTMINYNNSDNNINRIKKNTDPFMLPKPIPVSKAEFHTPPMSDNSTGTFNKQYYDENPTVFGSILRGEISSSSLDESNTLYSFQDIHPAAPLHGLVIPKKHIKSVYSLTPNDLPMLYEMKKMAYNLIETYTQVSVDDTANFLLVFHIPPFYTVDHLHLHVLAPVEEMKFYYRQVKYPSTEVRWCTHIDNVIRRLESGKSPVPYKFR